MATKFTPTADLRTPSQGAKRDAARKAKWHLGTRDRNGNVVPSKSPLYDYCHPRERDYIKRVAAHDNHLHNQYVTADPNEDWSGDDESIPDEFINPPDVEITYSFDAPTGPVDRTSILSTALDQAEQRFESREVERMVKTEYEMLDARGDAVVQSPTRGKRGRPLVTTHDEAEDYEFV